MISALRARNTEDDGFTLIELLVVVIIIGILAAIAIPAFLNQRENAYYSAAESDVRNAAIEVESSFVRTGAYPADGTDLTTIGARQSENVTLTYVSTTPNDGTFEIQAVHALVDADGNGTVGEATDIAARYCSDTGGIQADAMVDTCP